MNSLKEYRRVVVVWNSLRSHFVQNAQRNHLSYSYQWTTESCFNLNISTAHARPFKTENFSNFIYTNSRHNHLILIYIRRGNKCTWNQSNWKYIARITTTTTKRLFSKTHSLTCFSTYKGQDIYGSSVICYVIGKFDKESNMCGKLSSVFERTHTYQNYFNFTWLPYNLWLCTEG